MLTVVFIADLYLTALFAACVSAQSLTTEVQRPYLPLYEEVIQRVADHMPCQTLAVCPTQFEVLVSSVLFQSSRFCKSGCISMR